MRACSAWWTFSVWHTQYSLDRWHGQFLTCSNKHTDSHVFSLGQTRIRIDESWLTRVFIDSCISSTQTRWTTLINSCKNVSTFKVDKSMGVNESAWECMMPNESKSLNWSTAIFILPRFFISLNAQFWDLFTNTHVHLVLRDPRGVLAVYMYMTGGGGSDIFFWVENLDSRYFYYKAVEIHLANV